MQIRSRGTVLAKKSVRVKTAVKYLDKDEHYKNKRTSRKMYRFLKVNKPIILGIIISQSNSLEREKERERKWLC